MYTIDLVLILLSMLGSALFSGLEIAFVSCNKLYVELQRKQGAWWAVTAAGLLKKPSRVIGTLLIGNNIALVVYGIVMARVIGPWVSAIYANEIFVLMVQTTLSTLLILVVAEFVPKALFRIDPNGVLTVFAIPLRVLYVVLWLPMMLMTGISEGLLRLFGIRGEAGKVSFGRIDLDEFLREMSENAPRETDMDAEVEYFRNTLALSATKVRDLMIPRAEIEAIDVEEPIDELQRRFAETGLSKVLIYKDSIDNIIGYVHGYDMFRRPRTIRAILRPVDFIPGTMPADDVLQKFTKQRTHMAVVVDEFGGTAGLLTIEDVVETIVGDIEDEHDSGELVEERVGPDEFLFSGRVEVGTLREKHGLLVPESEEYDTLAGYLMHLTGDIPERGGSIETEVFRFTVAQVAHGRIDLVRLQVKDAEKGYSG
ncbi:MAG: HlyC/CorC family transporter [Flavobacteriales bacterium]|nr:HlyC/CorC family transporter [Flavobacteriales bacterium]MCB9167366.1 HlyC/CorC family transporter [Flavobacteriales bacterium]